MTQKIKERIYATGTWKANSAIHLGGEDGHLENDVDMSLLRDSNGEFFIPGGSIAGAGRSQLASRLLKASAFRGGLSNEPIDLQALFGGKYTSILTVSDAYQTSTKQALVRDGVRISPLTETAEDHAKYNFEVLPAGASFDMKLCLVRYESAHPNSDEVTVLQYFQALLQAFESAGIRLGARTRRGLGEGKVATWKVFRLSMANPAHVDAWLHKNWQETVAAEASSALCTEPLMTDLRRRMTITSSLAIKTSILIRTSGDSPGAPDMVHHTEARQLLLPGTSVAGAFLNRVEKIANTMVPDARRRLTRLFRPAAPTTSETQVAFRSSPITIDEGPLRGGQLMVQGRTAIDRFTGGTLSGALFDEAPFWPDGTEAANWEFRVSLELEDEREQDDPLEAALVLQAFKDLWLGDLAIGGETGGGRGVMRGISAILTHPECGELKLAFRPGELTEAGIEIERGDWSVWNELGAIPKEVANAAY